MANYYPPKMNMIWHGGHCCGIKTIHNFSCDPDFKLPAVAATGTALGFDIAAPGRSFEYRPKAMPEETALERLDRLLKYKDKKSPYGVVEAVLAATTTFEGEDPPAESQVARWEPILLERGFVLVTECYNSNSGNTIYIYHRVKTKPKLKRPAPANKERGQSPW